MGTFDLDVTFNPGLAQFDSVSFGDPSLGDMLAPVTPSWTASSLNVSGDSLNLYALSMDDSAALDAFQPSGFTLATLHFTAIAPGSGVFGLANIVLGDGDGVAILPDNVQVANVQIGTQAVPEGGPEWVAAFSFGVLVFAHRRLSRRPEAS